MKQVSGKNQLIWEDIKRWVWNVLVFSSGSIIVFLIALQTGATLQEALLALYGALLNALIDLFKKWHGEITYINGTVIKKEN